MPLLPNNVRLHPTTTPPSLSPSPPWGPRRLVLANLGVVAVACCFVALYRFAAALFILFVGVALGMAVKPGVERLRRRGIPRWAGALAITLAFGAAAAGVLILAVPVVAQEAEALVS